MTTLIEPATLLGQMPPAQTRMPNAADPCATCGVCCFSYLVPLTGFDVWRISRGLGLAASEFVVGYPIQAGAESGFQLCAGGESFELALEKRGAFERGLGVCVSGVDRGWRSRCGIYALRPVRVRRAYSMVADVPTVFSTSLGRAVPGRLVA